MSDIDELIRIYWNPLNKLIGPRLGDIWEVGHIQYVTSRLLHVRFQLEKVRLLGLGFNDINPFCLMHKKKSKVDAELRKKNIIFRSNALGSCVPAHQTLTTNLNSCIIFYFRFDCFSKMDHFLYALRLFDSFLKANYRFLCGPPPS